MKKLYKKLTTAILALCLSFICFSVVSHAAEGTLQFSDPSAAAGDTVEVKAKVEAGGAALGDVDITVTYDPTLLKFDSGTNAAGENGTLKLSSKGDGAATEANFLMKFTALKEGKAALTATASTAYLFSNDTVNLTLGASEVTIQGGTPVTDAQVQAAGTAATGNVQVVVGGKTYTVNENFSEAAIPKGFEATDAEIDGKATKAMIQKSSGQHLFYLDDGSGNSDYYLYSTEDGSFQVTEVVAVSTELNLFLKNHTDKEGLPSEYKETTTSIGGKEFTAWNNVSAPDFYLVYALSSEGTEGYYQYDTAEGTYQRYTTPGVTTEKTANTFVDKVINFAKDKFVPIMCGIWGVFLILLIILIVLAVKLSHRNQELDDLYDEYDIDDSVAESKPKSGKKEKSARKQKYESDDYDEEYSDDDFVDDSDEYDDEYEDEYEDDEEYEDAEYDEYDDDQEYDEYDDEQEYEEYDEDEYEEDEFQEEPSSRKRGQKSKGDYSVDFIDI